MNKKTNSKTVINGKKRDWLLRHALTVFSCVLIVALGIATLTYADPITTIIGENISTNDLSVTGNITSGNWQGTAITDDYIASSANWNTAYGWGDWSGQGFITAYSTNALTNKSGNISMWVNDSGYLTGNETITLSGDITGSGITAISTILGNGIDATKLADGSISDTEFQYLNGVTSALQTQLNNKIAIPDDPAQGDVLFRNALGWTGLGHGTSGYFLKTQGESADPVWSAVSTTYARTATKVVCASGSVDTTNCDYLCSGAGDQSEINTAITASTGGSVVLMEGTYTISTPILMNTDSVSLIGQGKGIKIQLGTAVQSNIIESTGGHSGLLIANLYLDGTTSAVSLMSDVDQCGIYFNNVDDSKVRDVQTENNKMNGISLFNSEKNVIIECICEGNTRVGVYLEGSSNENVISNNSCQNNNVYGIEVFSDSNSIKGNNCSNGNVGIEIHGSENCIVANICKNNSQRGIYLAMSGAKYNAVVGNYCESNKKGIEIYGAHYNLLVGNNCRKNTEKGIYLYYSDNNNIVANTVLENSQYGILADYGTDYNNIQENLCRKGDGQNYGIRINSSDCIGNIIANNDFYDAGGTANFSDVGTNTIVRDNRGTEITDDKVLVRVKNTSTVELVLGDVVILKSVATGNEITTTTVAGDDKVFGMVVETIANNATGLVQTLGKTVSLKVDGTIDIAVGDFLGTFTSAKIGMKAGNGDMAFAIALEAYATDDSNGVIDALLITPRKL